MQLTKNFTSEEFQCPCCGEVQMGMEFVENLQMMRDLYGKPIKITSGYRCPEHNADVGGTKNSKHMLGVAVDIAISSNADAYRIVQLAMSLGFTGVGIGMPLPGSPGKHLIHLDMRHLHDYPELLWSYQ